MKGQKEIKANQVERKQQKKKKWNEVIINQTERQNRVIRYKKSQRNYQKNWEENKTKNSYCYPTIIVTLSVLNLYAGITMIMR